MQFSPIEKCAIIFKVCTVLYRGSNCRICNPNLKCAHFKSDKNSYSAWSALAPIIRKWPITQGRTQIQVFYKQELAMWSRLMSKKPGLNFPVITHFHMELKYNQSQQTSLWNKPVILLNRLLDIYIYIYKTKIILWLFHQVITKCYGTIIHQLTDKYGPNHYQPYLMHSWFLISKSYK